MKLHDSPVEFHNRSKWSSNKERAWRQRVYRQNEIQNTNDNQWNSGKASGEELPAKQMNGGECVHSFPPPTLDTVAPNSRTTAVPIRNDMACTSCVLYVRETKGW